MKSKTSLFLLHFIGLMVVASHCFAQTKPTKPKEKSMNELWGDEKVNNAASTADKAKFFDDSNFGMFIHWGLFSSLGGKWNNKTYYGIGEWIMNSNMADIPVKDYKLLAKDFNPQGFDAKAIVKIAKDAGMKYIIITSKHHEGFAMFKSKASPFNIVDATPFARDPMKELSAACHEAGLGFGFYYSHNQDWTTPGGSNGPQTNDDGSAATFEDYFYKKCLPQVKEICSNYGAIDFVWFDTPGDMKKELVVQLVDVVRKLQPKAMLCSRVGHNMGDYASKGDMEVPKENIPGLWETCDTNNDSWSYAWYDNNFKSPKEILSRLIATVARGGSYLFNVGPNGNGVIPEIGAKFLKQSGDWIKRYPQVVYAAGPSPWGHALPWGDVTTKGNAMFLSVFEWPRDGKLYLPGLNAKIVSATLLGGSKNRAVGFTNKAVSFTKDKDWTVFNVPYQAADSPVSVIQLNFDVPAASIKVANEMGIYPNIKTELFAHFAEVSVAERTEIQWMEKFGEWKHVNQVSKWGKNGQATWVVNVNKPGYYYLDLRYKGKGKLVWSAETDEGIKVQNQQAATEKYNGYPMGILEFKTGGKHKITVRLIEGDPESSSLESVIVSPINE